MGNWLAVAWIDGMGVAHTVFFKVVAVVSRGGDGAVINLDNSLYLRHQAGQFDGDSPGVTLGVAATETHFTADFNQIIWQCIHF